MASASVSRFFPLSKSVVGKTKKKIKSKRRGFWRVGGPLNVLHLTNWILLLAGLANVAIGIWKAVLGSTAVAGVCLTAGLLFLLAATMDRFEFLKGLSLRNSGIEAKSKAFNQRILQADEALAHVRQMTESAGTTFLNLTSRAGRWRGVPSPRESFDMADSVRNAMSHVGSDQGAIQQALWAWAQTACRDIAAIEIAKLSLLMYEKENGLNKKLIRLSYAPDDDDVDSKIADLKAQIHKLQEFRASTINRVTDMALDDYPDKFLDIFTAVPAFTPSEISPLLSNAARFAPGMQSLRENRTVADRELWIETLEEAWNKPLG